MKTKLYNYNIYAGVLGLLHACFLVGGSVSVSPYVPRLVDSAGFLMVPLTLLAPSIFPFPSSSGFLKLCLMFDCGSVHLFPSVTGKSLSDHDYVRFLSRVSGASQQSCSCLSSL